MDITVSLAPIRTLVASLAGATQGSVDATIKSVVASAHTLVEAIGGSTLLALWDPQGPERAGAKASVKEAIKKLSNAKGIDEQKKQLIYLQSMLAVMHAFYGRNDNAFSRSWDVFIGDVQAAPGLLVKHAVVPIVRGAAKVSGSVLWETVKGLWPLLLIGGVALVIVTFVKKRF